MTAERIKPMNGVAHRSAVEGWVIALLPSRAVIGAPVFPVIPSVGGVLGGQGPYPTSLSPCYAFDGGLAQVKGQRPGEVGLACQVSVTPLLGLISLDSIDLPPGTPLVALDLLHERERAGIANQVANCVEMMRQMRAGLSGIQLAPAGLKLPPMPGAR